MWPGIHAAGGGLRYRVYRRWVGREEGRGHRSLEGSARRVGGPCRRSRLARCSRRRCDGSAGRACLGDGRRDSDSGGARASGISTVFAWETPVAMRGYRFPDDGSLLRIGRVTASAERGSGDAMVATGSVVLRSVELFGGMLRVDVVRARASLRASDGAVADASVSHVVNVRLDGDPIELVPGKKLWVKGWGYAVVDDPVAREDSTGAGDTLAGLRLHLTSAHSGLPAGTDIVLGRVHADLEHIATAPAPDPGGSGGSGTTGTLPDRQANPPRKHRRGMRQPPTAPRHGGRQGKPGSRHHRARAATARSRHSSCDAAAARRPRRRSARCDRARGPGPGRMAVRVGRREPHGGRVRLLRPRRPCLCARPAISFPGARRRMSSGRCPCRSTRPTCGPATWCSSARARGSSTTSGCTRAAAG